MMLESLGLAALLAVQASPTDQCAIVARHGTYFDEPMVADADFSPTLTVVNEPEDSAIVRLQQVDGPQSATFAVGPGRSFTINVPEGLFELRVAFEGKLAADCVTLIEASSIFVFDQAIQFETLEEISETVNGQTISRQATAASITLFQVENGNVEMEEADVADFNLE